MPSLKPTHLRLMLSALQTALVLSFGLVDVSALLARRTTTLAALSDVVGAWIFPFLDLMGNFGPAALAVLAVLLLMSPSHLLRPVSLVGALLAAILLVCAGVVSTPGALFILTSGVMIAALLGSACAKSEPGA